MDDDDFEDGPAAAAASGGNGMETVPEGAVACGACDGAGATRTHSKSAWVYCERCAGAGFLGVSVGPTSARPGSRWKVAVLASRYARGLGLWHAEDDVLHGAEGLS